MAWATHSAAAALVARGARVLMVRQRRPSGTRWELPGGYREQEESFEETAAREVLEETGTDVELGALLCTLVWEREHDLRRLVVLYFLATADASARPRPQIEEDIDEAAFVDPRGVWEDVHPLERSVLERWAAGERGFHVRAEIAVDARGRHSYDVR